MSSDPEQWTTCESTLAPSHPDAGVVMSVPEPEARLAVPQPAAKLGHPNPEPKPGPPEPRSKHYDLKHSYGPEVVQARRGSAALPEPLGDSDLEPISATPCPSQDPEVLKKDDYDCESPDSTSRGRARGLRSGMAGRWPRKTVYLLAFLLLISALAIGLGVGLGVGLPRHRKSTAATAPTTTSPAASPSPASQATCKAGVKYCGYYLIQTAGWAQQTLVSTGSKDVYNDLYLCHDGNRTVTLLQSCGGENRCQPPDHLGTGCDSALGNYCCG